MTLRRRRGTWAMVVVVCGALNSACILEVTGFNLSSTPEASLTEPNGPGLSDYWNTERPGYVRFSRTNGQLWVRDGGRAQAFGPIRVYDVSSYVAPRKGAKVHVALFPVDETPTRGLTFIETGAETLDRLWIGLGEPGRIERPGLCTSSSPKLLPLTAHPRVWAKFECSADRFKLAGFVARPGAAMPELLALITSGLIQRGALEEYLRVDPR